MTAVDLARRTVRFVTISTDDPELLKAQYAMLTRLIPLMYCMLVVNCWILSATHIGLAPTWLVIYFPATLTAACAMRLILWWRQRNAAPGSDAILWVFARTIRLTAIFAFAYVWWVVALFPYGDAPRQIHTMLCVASTVIACVICLTQMRAAALLVTAISTVGFVSFFLASGNITSITMAMNFVLNLAAVLIVVLLQNRDFVRMVKAQIEARRRAAEQSRLMRMIDDMPVAVMTVDPETFVINYVNETSRRTLGSIEHLLPIKVADLLGSSLDVFHRHPAHQRRILANPKNLPHSARIKLGPEVLDLKASAIHADDGSYLGPMLSWAIVTREVEAENRIRQLAHYDMLTGLPNRITFDAVLEEALATPGNRAGLLFIDLDGFKLVNDSRGHRIGDLLLRQVAERLRSVCNAPAISIGRLGGDEFGVLLPHNNPTEATAHAARIITALR
jgi:predicted signal transduction protein with EAL and GGDEF domain